MALQEKKYHQRGLRQGDPLSPMLFILVMDVLCHIINKVVKQNMLQPLARRALRHRISLYADDVVLFLRPSADIEITLDILQLFGTASGHTTNLQKAVSFPSSAVKMTKYSCRNPCHAKSLSFHVNTRGFLSPLTNSPKLKQCPLWKE